MRSLVIRRCIGNDIATHRVIGRSSTKLPDFLMKIPTETGSMWIGPSDDRCACTRFEDRPLVHGSRREVLLDGHRRLTLVRLVGASEPAAAVIAFPSTHPEPRLKASQSSHDVPSADRVRIPAWLVRSGP